MGWNQNKWLLHITILKFKQKLYLLILQEASLVIKKKYNLILTSESLKKPIITQLVETLNNDGSFILAHYVEGVKVATLYFNKESELINIEVEEINATTRALPSNFLKCFNAKYSQLKKEYREFVGEFVADMTETMAAPSLAATAAADCAGMFDNIGIK